MASDDWRVTVTLHTEEHAGGLRQSLHEYELEEETEERLAGRVLVGGGDDPGVIYLYAATSGAARDAEAVVRGLLDEEGVSADFELHRWNAAETVWEPEGTTADDGTDEFEHDPPTDWEVRVALPTHEAADALADRLASRYPVLRRWRYLLVLALRADEQIGRASCRERV